MPTTSSATASGPSSVGVLPKATITKTSTKVPMISVTTFQTEERMAGAVQKTSVLRPGLGLGVVELLVVGHPGTAGADEGADHLPGDVDQRRGDAEAALPAANSPRVTAGLMCAPDL